MTWRTLLIGALACLGFGFGTSAVVGALGLGHTTYLDVRDGCVVEITQDVWGDQTDETVGPCDIGPDHRYLHGRSEDE